jgi:predicted amidohydrolase YtcJ
MSRAGKTVDTRFVIRRAQLLSGECFDFRIAQGRIVEKAPQLLLGADERLIDAAGGALLPGLHDHHLHLFATASARTSLRCGPDEMPDEEALYAQLQAQLLLNDDPIRGMGFHDSVCESLDRHWLDRCCGDRIVRIQHRSGMMWVFNSAAIEALKLSADEVLPEGAERDTQGQLTGRFINLDAWLGQRFQGPRVTLASLSAELASMGISAVTDTGVNNNLLTWQSLVEQVEGGHFQQQLLVMGSRALHKTIGDERISVGAVKLYLREASLPELDEFKVRIQDAHEHGRVVAIHCVTRVELYFALAALEAAGCLPGDRIEHAAIADSYAIEKLAELEITVVTQPHFIAERGDQYRQDVDMDDQAYLYRGAGFIEAGVALAAGSDAPYGAVDPWASMRAAVSRRSKSGHLFGHQENLSARQALALYGGDLHRPGSGLRELEVGQIADLCLMDCAWETVLDELNARHVVKTFRAGQPVYERSNNKC